MNTLSHLQTGGQSTVLGSSMLLYNRNSGVAFEMDASKFRVRKLQKRIHAWAEVIADYIKSGEYRLVMITLTYAEKDAWRANHIKEFRMKLKKTAGDGLIAYAWCAELQERGAVHYHFLALAKRGTSLPKPDKSGLWKYGMSKIETAKTPYYICKYTGKEHQKRGPFPKGLRMFAVWVSKKIQIDAAKQAAYKLSSLPKWLGERLKMYFDITDKLIHARRIGGGGWVDDLGSVYWSPWSIFSPELQAGDREKWGAGLRYRFAVMNKRRAERIEQNLQIVEKFNDDWAYRRELAVASHQV